MSHQESAAKGPDGRMVDRMLFFSDAVFAIVLTLLVIELHPPHVAPGDAGFAAEARKAILQIVFFAMSFGLVAIFWAAHMQVTRRLAVFDWPMAWANLVLLFPIALMPFASAGLMVQGINVFSWQVYCAVLVAASLAQTGLWLVASRGGGRFMGGVHWKEWAFRTLRGLSPGIAFAAGYAGASLGRLDLAIWCWVLIFPLVLMAGALFGGRHPKPA
jgi:Endosomal/lysosomal potassium channel TMEM175